MPIKPTIIAHRGFSAEAPENTLASIQLALEIGVDFIEFDLHLSRDGVPVLMHDRTLERTAQHPLAVSDLSLEELKQLDVGSWFHPRFAATRIPTLGEVLALPRGETGLMIEIKAGDHNPSFIVSRVLEEIRKAPSQGPIFIGSFEPQVIQATASQNPSMPLIGIAESFQELEKLCSMGLKHLALWEKILTPSLIADLHKEEITLWTFTVDDAETAKQLEGIDGIITNNPRIMQKLYKREPYE